MDFLSKTAAFNVQTKIPIIYSTLHTYTVAPQPTVAMSIHSAYISINISIPAVLTSVDTVYLPLRNETNFCSSSTMYSLS